MFINNHQPCAVIKSLLLMFCILSPGMTIAACVTSDLSGTWYLTGISGNVAFGTLDETDRCKLTVSSAGTIVPSTSSCQVRDDSGFTSGLTVSGNFYINSACNVTGAVLGCFNGLCRTAKVQYAKMDKGKTVMSMVGYVTDSPDDVISWTAIK